MAFTVEDGTGVAGANSLTTVAFFRTYFSDRGISGTDVSALPDATVEQLLIRATDYLVKRFGSRLKGTRATETQTLPLPRSDVYIDGVEVDDESVPDGVQQATCEYALRASEMFLAPDPPKPFDSENPDGTTTPGGGIVQRKREVVDVIEEDTTFGGGENGDITQARNRGGTRLIEPWMIQSYPEADLLIEPFLRGTGRVVR